MHAIENTTADWIEIVRRKASAMRFGSVHIVIHEGRVTQVEATERTRLQSANPRGGVTDDRAARETNQP